jgi:hypothetical protein
MPSRLQGTSVGDSIQFRAFDNVAADPIPV